MFPLIRSQLANDPDTAKKVINVLLAPLAVCDVSFPIPLLYTITMGLSLMNLQLLQYVIHSIIAR